MDGDLTSLSGTDELQRNPAAQKLGEAIEKCGMEFSEVQNIASHENDFAFDLLPSKIGDTIYNVAAGIDHRAGEVAGGVQGPFYNFSNSKHFFSLSLY